MTERRWCAYCGEPIAVPDSTVTVFYEGDYLAIHRHEHTLFRERGLLKYREHPRRGPLSETAKDVGTALFVFWFIFLIQMMESHMIP